MKKYSLLIVLSCLGNPSFASELFTREVLEGRQIQGRKISKPIAKFNAFTQSLGICRDLFTLLGSDDVDPEVKEEFRRYVNGIIAHIDTVQEKINSIILALQEMETRGDVEMDGYFEDISFDSLLTEFIEIRNNALQ